MRRKKVGLALGGGAARGIAHVGVLKVLQKEGIPVDAVAGTSAGAIIGALLARGKNAAQIEELVLDVSRRRWVELLDPGLSRAGLIHGDKLKDLLAENLGGDIEFGDLEIPFACVAADINTGEEIVLDRDSVAEAVRASISIPGIFTPVRWQGRYLVDGGIVNPVPASILWGMGAEMVIGVNVIPGMSRRARWAREGARGNGRAPNLIDVMVQSMLIGTYALARESLEHAGVIIEPDVVHIRVGDIRRARECIRQGEVAASGAVADIKALLESGRVHP